MITRINGKEYPLRDRWPVTYTNAITLFIVCDSADDIVDTIGEKATVVVPDEYTGNDLVLDYIRRSWDTGVSICETAFKPVPIADIVSSQADDIEAISEAIVELAEIIGGDE